MLNHQTNANHHLWLLPMPSWNCSSSLKLPCYQAGDSRQQHSSVKNIVCIGESGHTLDTFSFDVICLATIQVWRTTNTVAVGPVCGLYNSAKHWSWLKLLKREKWKCRTMSKIQKSTAARPQPSSGLRSGRVVFRYSDIEFYPREELQYFQNNTIHIFRSMGDETLYQELHPHTYTQTYTYTFTDLKSNSCIHLSKKTAYSLSYYLII